MERTYRNNRRQAFGAAVQYSLFLLLLLGGLFPRHAAASYVPGEVTSCRHNEREYIVSIKAMEGEKDRKQPSPAKKFDVENCSGSITTETGIFSFTHTGTGAIDRCTLEIAIENGSNATASAPEGDDGCSGSISTDRGDYSFTNMGTRPFTTTVMSIELCRSADPVACEFEEVTVSTQIVITPPEIVTTAPEAATEGLFYSYEAKVEYKERPSVVWAVKADDTCGGSIDAATGIYIFTPSGPIPAASCTLSIEVCDGGVPDFCDDQSAPVAIKAVNDSPVVTSSAPGAATEDRPYRYEAAATDHDGPGAAWSVLGDDTCGGAISISTGEYGFTPRGPVPASSCRISIKVCDGGVPEKCDSQKAAVSIKAVNDGPEIITTAPAEAVEGLAYRYTAAAADEDGPGARWSVGGDDSCGGTVAPSTGEYSFTPQPFTSAPTCVLSISVCDGGAPGACDKEKAVVTIAEGERDPVAVDDKAATTPRTEVVIPVLENDLHDDDGILYLVSIFTGDTLGQVKDNGDGTVTYNPDGRFDHLRGGESATDMFEYTVRDGEGRYATAIVTVTVALNAEVAGDWNGDGHPDIFWRNYQTGRNYVLFMEGNKRAGGASLPSLAGSDWVASAVSDFNADGYPDILWRNYTTGANRLWYMNGAARADELLLPAVAAEWFIAGTGDFNGDGGVDILWRNDTSGKNYVSFMNGASPVGGALLPKIKDRNWDVAGLADLNADGQPDLLWRHAVSGRNFVWLMDGTKVASRKSLKRLDNTAWEMAGLADFNGDGRPDIHWRHADTGENLLWHMDGTAYTGIARLPAAGDTAWHPEY